MNLLFLRKGEAVVKVKNGNKQQIVPFTTGSRPKIFSTCGEGDGHIDQSSSTSSSSSSSL